MPRAAPVPVEREVRLLDLPTHESLRAAHDLTDTGAAVSSGRRLVVVGLRDADRNVGWGECSALNAPTYSPEWADDAFAVLADSDRLDPATHPMAAAAEEMARLDLALRVGGRSLVAHLADGRPTVDRLPMAAVVGLPAATAGRPASVDDLVGDVGRRVDAGARRVKLKVVPGWLGGPVRAVTDAFADLEVQVDANGSLGPDDLDELAGVADRLSAIEQPFTDVDLTRRLAGSCPTPILFDEGTPTAADIRSLVDADLGLGVVLKPPRLGGLGAAAEVLAWCAERGVPTAAGGMLECGLGRHALAAFAALPGLTITGDVSPARQWLAADPWPDLAVTDGEIVVPGEPGVAPLPDLDELDRLTVARY